MDAAASMIEKAIIANPTYAEAYNNLGVLYRDAGDISLAINAYEQCLKIDPDSRNAGQNRLLAMNYKIFPDRHNGDHSSIYSNPVDHPLPANRCTSNVDEEVLNLSLSIGLEGSGRKRASSTCFELKNISCRQNIINLEESTEGISKQEANYAGGLSFAA